MGEFKKRSKATQEVVQKALKAFGAEIYEPRHPKAKNEASTKRYLIEPFLLKVLGLDTRRPDHVDMEVNIEGHRGGAADFVLLHDGRYWCVVETKKLGSLQGGVRTDLWNQLSHYANSATFREVNYFVLTDGRWWVWYKREPNEYLPKVPFLEHDVSSPSSEVLTWCQAANEMASVDDLASAASRVRFTSALRQWLNGLKTPTDQTLERILGNEVFADLRGKGKRNLVKARNELRSVWDSTFEDVLGGSGFPPSPPPPPPSPSVRGFAWRLGKTASWNVCKTGNELMVAVIKALADRSPTGAAEWFQTLATTRPKWICRNDVSPPFNSWAGRDLGEGYSVHVSLSNHVKDERLLLLAEDITARTGADPELEMQWPNPHKRKTKSVSDQKVDVFGAKASRPRPRSRSCQWRLGDSAEWHVCESGRDMMVAVVQALAKQFPGSPSDWYSAVQKKKPTWINQGGTDRPIQSWRPRDLGAGFSLNVNLSSVDIEKRLRQLADLIRNRSGKDPQLDIRWNVESELGTKNDSQITTPTDS